MNLNRRKSNDEIRLHKTARSTSQFIALPKLAEIEEMTTTKNIDMSSLKYTTCPELPPLEHVIWECTQFSLLYSECKVKCDQGFKFAGESKARKHCEPGDDQNEKMVWVDDGGDPMGQCEPISCPNIEPLENGNVECSDVSTTAKCEFFCQESYLLSGLSNGSAEHAVSCLATEQWNGQIDNLTCQPLYCPTFSVDDTVTVDCDDQEGAYLVGGVQCTSILCLPMRR